MTEGSFPGVGGLSIFTRTWRPATPPRAVVVIAHGFNSHSGQYEWVAEQFVKHGLAVYALDHRGRGRSDGERFYVEHFTDYTSDLATFITATKAKEPGLPVFLLGHSAGGVISCGYVLEHQTELAGFICESFAYRVPAPNLLLAIVKGISGFVPRAQVLMLQNVQFSRDPAVVARLNADPLIRGEKQPAKTVAEMVRANEMLEVSFPKITLPVLIIHGTEEQTTRPAGSRFFYETVGSADKTLKLYEGHFHDLFADHGRERVMADVQEWIDTRLPA